jgi:hypothetical protein
VLRQISSLFEGCLTLAIAADGIALKTTDGQTHVLSSADLDWRHPHQLKQIIDAHQALFQQQTLNVVLSNTLVRYCVLPWQDGVHQESDWQAIAQHAFRTQYGATVNQWQVAVQLGAYGHAILAAAIDQTLIDDLNVCAAQHAFRLQNVTPLLSLLRSAFPHDARDWVLVAEPARLVLCQFKLGEWWQVQVDIPALGQEYAQAEQLIARSLLYVKSNEQPSKIASYIAPSLNALWKNDTPYTQKRMLNSPVKTGHAAWMASLPISHQTLNFASNLRPQAGVLSWLACLIATGIFALLAWQYQQANQAKQALVAQANNVYLQPTRHAPNPQLETQLALAQQTQKQLNTPWMPMFSALEKVNQQNPEVAIVQISPNPSRGEIKIKAETKAFKHITAYLESLRQHSAFGDAALTSQHLEQENAQLIYVFEVKAVWNP